MTSSSPQPLYAHQTLKIVWYRQIEQIDRAAWDALALPLPTPFMEWDWLHLMEASGSICAETGWTPQHLTLWADGRLVAAAPLYVKTHSRGEFVFDHLWADVAAQLRIPYYPKLVGMSPATPMLGYRFLMDPGQNEDRLTAIMLAEIDRCAMEQGLSGSHFLFVDPTWRSRLERDGYTAWQHQSFAWRNDGLTCFDDYLAHFNARHRRNIRRERNAMSKAGIHLATLSGDDLNSEQFDLMYRLYVRTNAKFGPWGCKYLNSAFFHKLPESYRRRLLLVTARRPNDPTPVAMSLLIYKDHGLYGRYWGAFEDLPALHFNACYYTPIEWAISHRIHRFDPGAGSPHKIWRGFKAVANHSLHRFYDQRLQQLFRLHIAKFNQAEQHRINELNRHFPTKAAGASG